jgi:hypothetical protein
MSHPFWQRACKFTPTHACPSSFFMLRAQQHSNFRQSYSTLANHGEKAQFLTHLYLHKPVSPINCENLESFTWPCHILFDRELANSHQHMHLLAVFSCGGPKISSTLDKNYSTLSNHGEKAQVFKHFYLCWQCVFQENAGKSGSGLL